MRGYISIKQILDDILEHPLLRKVSLERAVNYAAEFIEIVGCPKLFQEKTIMLDIEDYRAPLPCDFIDIIQIREVTQCGTGRTYRGTTDSFHIGGKKHDEHQFDNLTYKIQNQAIYFSHKDGEAEMSYRAMLLDEDGFPLIPDNQSFKKALEYYIKREYFTILFDIGVITAPVLTNAEQRYAWYVGQAQNELVKPSVDEMESITNIMNQLLVRVNEHSKGFINLGKREFIKAH